VLTLTRKEVRQMRELVVKVKKGKTHQNVDWIEVWVLGGRWYHISQDKHEPAIWLLWTLIEKNSYIVVDQITMRIKSMERK
jgi:hypothetical protein